jgi:hypothetical protein
MEEVGNFFSLSLILLNYELFIEEIKNKLKE